MSGGGADIMTAEAALADYIGDLLAQPDAAERQRFPSDDVAAPEFECRLIGAGGVTLAVRRQDVTAVHPWPDDYAADTESDGCIAGHGTCDGRRVALIDTARVILPANQHAALAALPDRGCEVLLIGDGWGLVSEITGKPLTLKPDAVRWRGESGRRPWLAGVVAEPQCALIDMAGLVGLFAGRGA